MKTSTAVWIVVIVLLLLGVWYYASPPSPSSTSVTTTTTPGSTANSNAGINGSPNQNNMGEPVIPDLRVASSSTLGDFLVAANGMTLYRYTKDTTGVSNCTGTCADNWPPYFRTKAGTIVADGSLTGAVAVTTRADGSQQMTYKGMPLYFWKGDAKPGDTTGQGVGGAWYVVKP